MQYEDRYHDDIKSGTLIVKQVPTISLLQVQPGFFIGLG